MASSCTHTLFSTLNTAGFTCSNNSLHSCVCFFLHFTTELLVCIRHCLVSVKIASKTSLLKAVATTLNRFNFTVPTGFYELFGRTNSFFSSYRKVTALMSFHYQKQVGKDALYDVQYTAGKSVRLTPPPHFSPSSACSDPATSDLPATQSSTSPEPPAGSDLHFDPDSPDSTQSSHCRMLVTWALKGSWLLLHGTGVFGGVSIQIHSN